MGDDDVDVAELEALIAALERGDEDARRRSAAALARLSDQRRERKLHTAIPLIVAGISFAMVTIPGQSFLVSMVWLCITGMSLWAWSPPFWVLPTITMGQSAAAASVGFINTVGNVGGFVGPSLVGYMLSAGRSPPWSCFSSRFASWRQER